MNQSFGKSISNILFVGTVAILIAASVSWNWYLASMKQRVWAREGIEMTTWEVFIGVSPLERSIRLVEPSGRTPELFKE